MSWFVSARAEEKIALQIILSPAVLNWVAGQWLPWHSVFGYRLQLLLNLSSHRMGSPCTLHSWPAQFIYAPNKKKCYYTVVFLKAQERVITYLCIGFIFKYRKDRMCKCQWEGYSCKRGRSTLGGKEKSRV